MFKKITTVLFMSAFMYLPQAQAAVVIDWVDFANILGEPTENDTVTDTSLRSVCIHAMDGGYYSLGPDFGSTETDPGTGINIHVCIAPGELKADSAFERLCTNKLKYNYAGVGAVGGVDSIYICFEPVQ